MLSYCLLVPQIIYNVRLGLKSSFEPYYLLGLVATKIIIPLYDRGCPYNMFRKRQEPYTVVATLLCINAISVQMI